VSDSEDKDSNCEEGGDLEDVGWMYMDGGMLPDYVGMYHLLTDVYAWEDYYQAPYEGYLD
jgi:hypothetical protein